MLTGEHLRVRSRQGKLFPAYVDPDDPKLRARAEELLSLFREQISAPRAELDAVLDGFAGDGQDRKLIEGLAKVALDKSSFQIESPITPMELRQRVFRAAALRGPLAALDLPGGPPTIADIYKDIAADYNVDPHILPDALYADHPEAMRLTAVDVPSAEWLLHRYNVGLIQALLLHAVELRIHLGTPQPGRARQLFRAIKFHQLIHTIQLHDHSYEIVLDGPASLFSQTTKYGMALARFFPALLLQSGPWTATAIVNWREKQAKLALTDTDGLRSHYRDLGAYETREAAWFAERFLALESGWTLIRDTQPVRQGPDTVVVPDFSFEKDGRKAHLEILGFWRKGTVERRLKLLERYGPANLIVAVSRKLCGAEAGELPDAIIPFAEIIPAKEVLRRVESSAS